MFEKWFQKKKAKKQKKWHPKKFVLKKQTESDSSTIEELAEKNKKTKQQIESQTHLPIFESIPKGPPFSNSLETNVTYVQAIFKDCCDLVVKHFYINGTDLLCALLYFEADADVDPIQNVLLTSALHEYKADNYIDSVDEIKERILPICDIKDIKDEETLQQCLLSGNILLFIEGASTPLFLNSKNVVGRSVSTPTMENVVFGAKEAFVENIRINTVLIRQRLRNQHLKIQEFLLGEDNITTVRLFYLDNKIDQNVLKEVQKRIRQLRPTVIANTSSFIAAIIDKPFLNAQLYSNTEKADVVANKLNEGKFALIVDGFPLAVLGPTVFWEQFNDIEDYSNNTYYATFIRCLRYLSFGISLLLAPLYIALTTFHPEMIPTSIYINLAAQRSEVPFPTIVELVLMLITFEIIREASIRLPSYISGTVSIVGALAIGQGVVLVGLVTTNALIVVAFTALASFVFPNYSISYPLRISRYILLFLATLYGFYGITLGVSFYIAHLANMKSFGVPYLAGFSPFYKKTLSDTLVKVPVKYLKPKLPYQANKQGGKHKND